jgi:hypothetical protein
MYQLVAEVLDHAPAGLDPAAVLLLLALAEDTRSPGEIREIPTDTLCRRTRVDPRGLRHVVDRLRRAGIKVRVPIGTDRRGKPLYAVPGRAPRWVLPPLPGPPGCQCRTCAASLSQLGDDAIQDGRGGPATDELAGQGGGPASPPTDQRGPTRPPAGLASPKAGHPAPPAGGTRPPSPSHDVSVIDQRRRPTLTYLIGATGASDDEARELLSIVTKRHRPRSVGAYVRGIPREDLSDLLDELRHAPNAIPTALRPQCGKCGPNRLVETRNGGVARCPDCHPGAPQARRSA